MRFDANEVKAAAYGRWWELYASVPELAHAVGGKHCADPTDPKSTDGLRLDKPGQKYHAVGGAWTKDGSKSGLDLMMYATGRSFLECLEDVASFFGVQPLEGDKAGYRVSEARKKAAANREQVSNFILSPKMVIERKGKLASFWKQAKALQAGDRVHKYLASRGITLDVSKVGGFRFHPSAFFKDEAGNMASAPCFIQKYCNEDGQPIQIHRIFLSKKKAGKAEIAKPKLAMKPCAEMAGGCVRIGRSKGDQLDVSTGIENALSVIQVTNRACWATLNDGMLRKFIPPKGVTRLTVWADNDRLDQKGRNSGVDSVNALREKLKVERPEIEVIAKIPPRADEDWNDLLTQGRLDLFK